MGCIFVTDIFQEYSLSREKQAVKYSFNTYFYSKMDLFFVNSNSITSNNSRTPKISEKKYQIPLAL